MVDIEKFKSEFKNMKMASDLMVKHDDVQKLIDKYLTKQPYYLIRRGYEYATGERYHGVDQYSYDKRDARKFFSLEEAESYLKVAVMDKALSGEPGLVFEGWE